jgi:micrococcal nuclease
MEMWMQILRTVIAFAVAVASTSTRAQTVKPTRSELVLVRSVFDGDTISVSSLGRVRLLGIDAPEISHGLDTPAPYGREAREKLSSLILHRWIRLETEGQALDAYNRRLAYVLTEDGQCINTVLVREGLARVSTRVPLSRLDELKRAEREAQALRRGIWAFAPSSAATGYTPRSGATRTSAPKHPPAKKGSGKKKKP